MAAGEAAGLRAEDKASGRKREAQAASSQSCLVTLAASIPLSSDLPGMSVCVVFGNQEVDSINLLGQFGHPLVGGLHL